MRENPWNFGMYDGQRYLDGHISFTEPLGSGAGEVLWLMRRALVAETRDEQGRLDGGLLLLTAVPAEWLDEGQEIALRDCVTYYGKLAVTIRSAIRSRREIAVEHCFEAFAPATDERVMPALKTIRVRLVTAEAGTKEISFAPEPMGRTVAKF